MTNRAIGEDSQAADPQPITRGGSVGGQGADPQPITKGAVVGAGREAQPTVDEPREGVMAARGGGHGQTGRGVGGQGGAASPEQGNGEREGGMEARWRAQGRGWARRECSGMVGRAAAMSGGGGRDREMNGEKRKKRGLAAGL